MKTKNKPDFTGRMACVIRRSFIIAIGLSCVTHDLAGVESLNIVGYHNFEMKQGWLWLEMPFKEMGGNYFTLNDLLKQNAAREGDVVYYYSLTPTNFNIILEAIVEQTDSGLHFFRVISKRADNGAVSREVNHEMNVDHFTLVPTLSSNDAKVRIRFFRKTDEVTNFQLFGEVSPLLMETQKVISDVNSLSAWIKIRICCQVYRDDMDSIVSMMAKEDSLQSGRSFVDELLSATRRVGPIYFYAYFKGKEDKPTRVLFNPINSKFINASEDGAGGEIEIDTSIIRKFGTVEDEFASNKIESSQRMPIDIIEEMNRLLHAGFFDYKELFWVVKKDGSTLVAMYDKHSHSVIDCRMGVAFNLERDDIVGLSDVPVPDDRSIERPPIIGRGRYLTHDEVKHLESLIMPCHINLTLWTVISWIIGHILQGISSRMFGSVPLPKRSSIRKVLCLIFYFVIPIGFIVCLVKRCCSIKKKTEERSTEVLQESATCDSEGKTGAVATHAVKETGLGDQVAG